MVTLQKCAKKNFEHCVKKHDINRCSKDGKKLHTNLSVTNKQRIKSERKCA